MDPLSVKRRLTCILAADAVGYSRHMGQDEEGTIRILSAHRAVIDGIIAFHNGRMVGTAGDSVLAEFGSAVEAVRCAVEIQDALKTRNDALPEHRQLQFRVGVNLGDVVVKNQDLLGDGVNVAARLETMAEPGGICISSSVYDQITGKLDLGFQDIGEQSLKNISRPIRVYRVSGAGGAVRPPPADAARPARGARSPLPWAIGAAVVVLVGAVAAWQGGWWRPAATAPGSAVTAAPAPTQPAAPVAEKPAPVADRDAAEAQRARADAEAAKRQADAEAVKRQAEAEAAKRQADAEAVKRQAQADAARIRAEAEASAASIRRDAEAKARDSEARVARAEEAKREPEPKGRGQGPDSTAATAPVASSRAVAADPRRFDGVWNVTIVCPQHTDGALGYTVELVAPVKDGALRGEVGTEGGSGWLRLDGQIQPDGSAKLDAKGMTGDPKYNVKGVAKGVPYAYQVAARFEDTRGAGRRLQLRECNLTFVKQ